MSQGAVHDDAKERKIERQKSTHAMFVAWKRLVAVTAFLLLFEATLPRVAPAHASSMGVLLLYGFSVSLAAHYLEMQFNVPAMYWWMGIWISYIWSRYIELQ
jgi:hypothetical protein